MTSHELAKRLLELPDLEVRMYDRDYGHWGFTVMDVYPTSSLLSTYSKETSKDDFKYVFLSYD